MKDEQKHMNPDNGPDQVRQKLDDYLADRMSPAERNAFEREMEEDPFMQDAAEGIELSGETSLTFLEKEINAGLRKQLSGNKKRKKRKPDFQTVYITIIIILLLLIASYWVISKLL